MLETGKLIFSQVVAHLTVKTVVLYCLEYLKNLHFRPLMKNPHCGFILAFKTPVLDMPRTVNLFFSFSLWSDIAISIFPVSVEKCHLVLSPSAVTRQNTAITEI